MKEKKVEIPSPMKRLRLLPNASMKKKAGHHGEAKLGKAVHAAEEESIGGGAVGRAHDLQDGDEV